MTLAIFLLVFVALLFAWSMGAHYTGAVMGMPHASGAIAVRPALVVMAVLTILGATFASGGVQKTVGLTIVNPDSVTVTGAIVMVLSAAILTTVFTYRRIPSSTIQIFVFSIAGTGVASASDIHWGTILRLAVLWVAAPIVATGLGYLFTRLFDLIIPPAEAARETKRLAGETKRLAGETKRLAGETKRLPGVESAPDTADPGVEPNRRGRTATIVRILPFALVAVGSAASFALGANDVANAVAVFRMTNIASTTFAGLLGGAAMAIGALTWGRRILKRVAFDVVKTDLSMASAAQMVQALVVLLAVSQGLFTSMNQALVGAMTGTGFARGNRSIQWPVVRGILLGWAVGPISGIVSGFVLYRLLELAGAR